MKAVLGGDRGRSRQRPHGAMRPLELDVVAVAMRVVVLAMTLVMVNDASKGTIAETNRRPRRERAGHVADGDQELDADRRVRNGA